MGITLLTPIHESSDFQIQHRAQGTREIMPDPITLKDIQQAAAALSGCGVPTLEDLRMCISKDVDQSIRWLSVTTGTKYSLLMALLIAEARDDAGRSGKRKLLQSWRGLKTFPSVLKLSTDEIQRLWHEKKLRVVIAAREPVWAVLRQLMIRHWRLWHNWRRHWPDALAIVIFPLLLLSLALRAQSINNKSFHSVTVKQSTALPAFQKITDGVEVSSVLYSKGAFTSVDEVRGRYTLVSLPAGATLLRNQILSAEFSNKMQDRRILSIPIKAGTYVPNVTVPCEAVLVLSARRHDLNKADPVSFEVILLSLNKIDETTSATVALRKDEFERVATLLASHDVFLSQTAP